MDYLLFKKQKFL